MAIQVHCAACSKVTSVPDEHAGKRFRCPGCKQGIRIPGTQSGSPGVTKDCPHCKTTIASSASACPACDKPLKTGRSSDGQGCRRCGGAVVLTAAEPVESKNLALVALPLGFVLYKVGGILGALAFVCIHSACKSLRRVDRLGPHCSECNRGLPAYRLTAEDERELARLRQGHYGTAGGLFFLAVVLLGLWVAALSWVLS